MIGVSGTAWGSAATLMKERESATCSPSARTRNAKRPSLRPPNVAGLLHGA